MSGKIHDIAKQYVDAGMEEALDILQGGVRMVDEKLGLRLMIRREDIPQAIAALPVDARCTICYPEDPSKKPETPADLCVITTIGNLIDKQSLTFTQYEKLVRRLEKFQKHPEAIPKIPVIDREVYNRIKETIQQ